MTFILSYCYTVYISLYTKYLNPHNPVNNTWINSVFFSMLWGFILFLIWSVGFIWSDLGACQIGASDSKMLASILISSWFWFYAIIWARAVCWYGRSLAFDLGHFGHKKRAIVFGYSSNTVWLLVRFLHPIHNPMGNIGRQPIWAE